MVTYSIKSSSDNVSDEPHLEIYLMKKDERLYIMATDPSGRDWYVANFTKGGSLRLISDIDESSGLNVYSGGYIRTTTIDDYED
jgi:hypothetical protein